MVKNSLNISADLSLPLDAVTQKIAWLGRTGSGKTYGCKRMVEQMLRAGAQVVILDGMGVWAGLRLGPNSFDVPVLGGLYGDIPLEPTAGALIADIVVDRGTSMILDVSQMLDAERTRFATAFAQRFFHRKKASPSAAHLVLEECQDYVPENEQPGERLMLHEFVRLSKQGRTLGIGISFISQRPQEISKKALNQVECVFAFQMTGPQERKALQYWLSDKGFEGKLADILPTLEVGAPHVWSPQWLKISKVVRILPIDTLDTSQTPKVGQKAFAQKKLEPIDLKELSAEMVATIERAKAEDPKALRARIAELEHAAKQRMPTAAPVAKAPKVVERPVFKEGQLDKLTAALASAVAIVDALHTAIKSAEALVRPLPQTPAMRPVAPRTARPEPVRRATSGHAEAVGLPEGERAVLTAIAMFTDGVTREQISILAGYKRSTRDAYLQRLRVREYIGESGGLLFANAAGFAALGDFEPLPTGLELQAYWLHRLPDGESRVLRELVGCYPKALDREVLGEAIGYKRSTRDAYLQRLRTRRLIVDERGGAVKASAELFG